METSVKTQVFSCKYCKILKNSLFSRTPVVAAAGIKAFFLVCDAYNFKIYEDSITQT